MPSYACLGIKRGVIMKKYIGIGILSVLLIINIALMIQTKQEIKELERHIYKDMFDLSMELDVYKEEQEENTMQ